MRSGRAAEAAEAMGELEFQVAPTDDPLTGARCRGPRAAQGGHGPARAALALHDGLTSRSSAPAPSSVSVSASAAMAGAPRLARI